MLTRMIRSGVALALLVAPAFAQEGPAQPAPDKPAPKKEKEKGKEAAAGAEKPVATVNDEGEEVKVLKPVDVAAELLRLKSKADIKAEVTIVPSHGREIVVKGVIRNGKLIERFAGKRFIPQKNINHSHSGVRLWWVNNTAGWIFVRYNQVKTIALTGTLTPEERRQIMEALQAQSEKKEEQKQAAATEKLEEELKKMSPAELEAYLLRHYPAEDGWNHDRLRALKRKQIIENQPLTREESVFVSYFPTLMKARLDELKRTKKKVEFEPGSGEGGESESRGRSSDEDDG